MSSALFSGVWHFGGSQREIPHRGLLCEPDITGAGVPQLCPVPALHREWEEVSGSEESLPPIRPSVRPSIKPLFLVRFGPTNVHGLALVTLAGADLGSFVP